MLLTPLHPELGARAGPPEGNERRRVDEGIGHAGGEVQLVTSSGRASESESYPRKPPAGPRESRAAPSPGKTSSRRGIGRWLPVLVQPPVTTGGILSAQGAAASKAAAARSTIASCRRRPTIWSPTGSPLFVKPHGTEMTGSAVTVMP
jgi:hypothetical protein